MDGTQIAISGVSLTNIQKSYGARVVLAGINMDLAQGELLCLLGPSGCGKTTLLRILAGFETPSAGKIVLNGAAWAWCFRPTACSPT
jgi:ABC-type Fe3+/spermidine/putrescine transport system ATPase subunit